MNMAVRPSRRLALSKDDGHSRGPLSYLELGPKDGPCVVFLHGFGADLLTWQLCLVPLSAQHRLIALDLLGHGRSTLDVGDGRVEGFTDWLTEAFDRLSVDRAILVGHSMGAKLALAFVRAHPDRVAGLGLVSPAGVGPIFDAAHLNAFVEAQDEGRASALACHLLGESSRALVPLMARSLMEAARHPERRAAMQTLVAQARSFGMSHSLPPVNWSLVKCPIHIVWGAQDRLIPLPDPSYLPIEVRLTVLDGIGHLPHLESPNHVINALKDLIS